MLWYHNVYSPITKNEDCCWSLHWLWEWQVNSVSISVPAYWTADANAAVPLRWYPLCHRYSVVFHTTVWRTSQWSTSPTRRTLAVGSHRVVVMCRAVTKSCIVDHVVHVQVQCLFDCCIQETVLLVSIVYYICPCFVLIAYQLTLRLSVCDCILFNFILNLTQNRLLDKMSSQCAWLSVTFLFVKLLLSSLLFKLCTPRVIENCK